MRKSILPSIRKYVVQAIHDYMYKDKSLFNNASSEVREAINGKSLTLEMAKTYVFKRVKSWCKDNHMKIECPSQEPIFNIFHELRPTGSDEEKRTAKWSSLDLKCIDNVGSPVRGTTEAVAKQEKSSKRAKKLTQKAQ